MPKLTAADIPGYAEAVAAEVRNRELAYLETDWLVCGIRIGPITPKMLVALFVAGSPFACGGIAGILDVQQFIMICGNYPMTRLGKWSLNRRLLRSIARLGMDEAGAVADVSEYLSANTQDAPSGGRDCIPYASQAAWLEYEMSGSPWRWSREQIMNTPIAIIYQQLRCKERAKGYTPVNPSDRIRAEWLDQLNSKETGTS